MSNSTGIHNLGSVLLQGLAATALVCVVSACGGSSATPSTAGGGDSATGGASAGAGAAGKGSTTTGGASMGGGASVGGAPGTGGGSATGMCNQPTITAATPCNGQYPSTSILALRSAKAVGCFELSHVGLVARTDSPSEPRVYLQDVGGGDSSAILGKCTPTATHACAPVVKARIQQLHDALTDGAQLSVRGYYQFGGVTGFEEFYIEDIIDECKNAPRPAPIALVPSDLTRDARVPAKWFRRATVNIPPSDPLQTYDFSPPELLLGAAQCPDYAGFAMIQKSMGATVPATCNGKANPPAVNNADANEVLIGRQFFNQFLFAADCACVGMTNIRLIKPTGAVSGTVLGYLILEQDKASTTAYQVFEPAADQAFPIQ